MNSRTTVTICRSLGRRQDHLPPFPARRYVSHSNPFRSLDPSAKEEPLDIEALLSAPTWSISSLLPPKDLPSSAQEITPKQLHHLLRLSALPPPKDQQEEEKMLQTLSSQLHFVKEIQKVDTTGIEPLRSLRDETEQGEKESELGLEAMKEALGMEEVRGKFHRRIRRRRDVGRGSEEAKWDPLGTAGRRMGRFFVVEGD